MSEDATRPDRPATGRQIRRILLRVLLGLLVAGPFLLSLASGYLTVVVAAESLPVWLTLVVAVLVWLPPAALFWLGARASWRLTSGWTIAAWIVAAWALAVMEVGAGFTLLNEALSPPS